MRGIGVGQTLVLLVSPEVADIVEKNACKSKSIGLGEKLFGRQAEDVESTNLSVFDDQTYTQLLTSRHPIKDLAEVCAWLVIRGIESESIQLRLLCQHNLFNVWRKRAFQHLCNSHSDVRQT